MNFASGVSCLTSTSSSFAMISLTRSSLNVPLAFTSLSGSRYAVRVYARARAQAITMPPSTVQTWPVT